MSIPLEEKMSTKMVCDSKETSKISRKPIAKGKPEGLTVNCPKCKQSVPWAPSSHHRPFCSQRCQLVDLGAWASESYKIPNNPLTGHIFFEEQN